MKYWGIILFMLLSGGAIAQRLNGIVIDKATGQPVPNAIIKRGFFTQLSTLSGDFSVPIVHFGDTIKITSMGYKLYNLVIGMAHKDTMYVYLEPGSVILNDVTINARRNHQLDSINTRKEFAKAFAYRAPTFMDAFIKVDPYEYHPSNYITATNSTASFASLNLLSISSLFGKSKTAETRLHQLALQDEELNYVNRKFSKQRVNALTGLQGDSLEKFIDRYRPNITEMKKMTDYDIMIYIKKCHETFVSEGK
jgi:hypothetical protein